MNKVALAQNLGLEYARSCRTMLDPNTVRRGGAGGPTRCARIWKGKCAMLLCLSPSPPRPLHLCVQILFLSQVFVKIAHNHRLMTVRDGAPRACVGFLRACVSVGRWAGPALRAPPAYPL